MDQLITTTPRITEEEIKSIVMSGFEEELTQLLNRFSQENDSNTPDYILANYLIGCLESYNKAVTAREKWYGRAPVPVDPPSTSPS